MEIHVKVYHIINIYLIKNLIRDSIIESLLFLILGFVLSDIIKKNRIILFFIIGFILHIVFEKLTLHKYYCQNICVVK